MSSSIHLLHTSAKNSIIYSYPLESILCDEAIKLISSFHFTDIYYIKAISLSDQNLQLITSLLRPLSLGATSFIILDCSSEGITQPRESLLLSSLKSEFSLERRQIAIVCQNFFWPNDVHLGRRLAYFDLFANEISKDSSLANFIKSIPANNSQKKPFICLNNNIHPHRIALFALLRASGLVDSAYYSFTTQVPAKGGAKASSDSRRDFNSMTDTAWRRFPTFRLHIEALRTLNNSSLNIHVDNLVGIKSSSELILSRFPWDKLRCSIFNVTTESNFGGGSYYDDNCRITEKILKPIMGLQPFIAVAPPYTLRWLRLLGFQTFEPVINEDYDLVTDPDQRLTAVGREISRLVNKIDSGEQFELELLDICESNYRYIFSEALRKKLRSLYLESLATILRENS